MFDVIIIGAGVTGAFISRELSKYDLNIALLDAHNDVGDGSSGANSAIIHSGYDPLPGTLKAKFNVLANPMWDQIASDLDFHFYRIGSLTIATSDEQVEILKSLKERSAINGVDVKLLSKEETLKLEPNLTKNVKGSLLAPSAGIVDPFNCVVHCVENAVDNGVKLFLNNKVISIIKKDDVYEITTSKDVFYSKIVINAAGVNADKIASMIEEIDWKIIARKGEYFLLDHFAYGFVNHTIFPLPSEKGKGILVSPTSSYNYIMGPSSEPVDDFDDVSTDKLTLDNVKKQAFDMVDNIPMNHLIKVFSGNRPTCTRHDFVIEYSKKDKHFVNVGGIESPGFVSAPAIAKYVVETLLSPIIELKTKNNYNPKVKKYHVMFDLSLEEKNKTIKENPEYGEIVCNCEKISLGEINDALSRSVPPHSIKGLKKRVRSGFGRCQGGFCEPKLVMILAKRYGISPKDVVFSDENSNILLSQIKEAK